MGLTSTFNDLTGGAYGDVKDAWGNAVGSVESAFAKTYHAAENTVNNILKNPLPVIETAALTYVLGPEGYAISSEATAAAMAQAAVKAANGGNMQDIALSVATSYAGAQIGTSVGDYAKTLDPDLTNTLKQVIASSSGSAAVTALRGGSLENILQSGVSGAVNGYVASALKDQGYTNVDQRLIANAASAATNAILKGKSVSDAIGQSVASTAISAALQGNIGQINKNNELLNGTKSALGLGETYDYWKNSAQDFYNKNFTDANPVFTNANTWADKTNQAISDYNLKQKTTLDDQAAFKDLFAKYQDDPTNQQLTIDTANAYQKLMDDQDRLSSANAIYQLSNYQLDAFNSKLAPLQQTYQEQYVAPLQEAAQQINDINSQNEKLAADIGQQVVQYKDQVLQDDTDLVKQIGDQAVAEALKTIAPLSQQSPLDKFNAEYGGGDAGAGAYQQLVGMGSSPEDAQKYVQNLADSFAVKNGLSKFELPDYSAQTPTGNLPSGVQLAAADTGTVSDAGSSPYKIPLGGVPIFAGTQAAEKVVSPVGYELMPMSLADEKPAGSYYDITQNAWFMPKQDVVPLPEDLLKPTETPTDAVIPPDVIAGEDKKTTGALPSAPDVASPSVTSNLPSADVTSGTTAGSTSTDAALSGLTAVGAGNGSSDGLGSSGNGSGSGSGGLGGGTTENIPEIVVTAPREPVLSPEEPTTPSTPTTPSVTPPVITPVTPTITPVTPTTTATTPAATQTKSPLSSTDLTPKFLDTNPRFLETKVVPGNQPHLQELRQLYSSLTPELAAALASKGIEAPTDTTSDTNMPTTQFMADGGSTDISKFADSLNPTSQNLGFIKPYSPNMLPAAPLMQNQMKLNPLRHLHESLMSRQRTAGGLADGGLPNKYAEALPKGHKPEFITGLTGYYASGNGTGQSDDIDAMLHDGDYVADADLVAALGDGSSKAGAEALEKFRRQVPHNERAVGGQPVPAKIADGEYVFPASFVTAIGSGDNKAGAKILDKMREAIRAHKRSAPTTKIPPKALSPLEYLKRAQSVKKP